MSRQYRHFSGLTGGIGFCNRPYLRRGTLGHVGQPTRRLSASVRPARYNPRGDLLSRSRPVTPCPGCQGRRRPKAPADSRRAERKRMASRALISGPRRGVSRSPRSDWARTLGLRTGPPMRRLSRRRNCAYSPVGSTSSTRPSTTDTSEPNGQSVGGWRARWSGSPSAATRCSWPPSAGI